MASSSAGAAPLETLVQQIVASSGSGSFAELNKELNKTDKLLKNNIGSIGDALDSLVIVQHSLGYLHLLYVGRKVKRDRGVLLSAFSCWTGASRDSLKALCPRTPCPRDPVVPS